MGAYNDIITSLSMDKYVVDKLLQTSFENIFLRLTKEGTRPGKVKTNFISGQLIMF